MSGFTGSTFNYFDPAVAPSWLISNTVVLSQQFQFCLEECNKFLADTSYGIELETMRRKCSMCAAYYMFAKQTYSIEIFRLTYCLRHIEDCWKTYDLECVQYTLRAVAYGIMMMITTLQEEGM